jgi:HAD superfamily hydrolase (TIGR01509 family)
VSNIDFADMRARTGIPYGDLFTVMEEWRDAARVAAAMDVILELEATAQRTLALQPGLEALLEQCVADGLLLAIVTRNTDEAVAALFARLGEAWRPRFTQVLNRHFVFVKPDRRLLLHVAATWGVAPSQLLMVGDSREDVEIGAICGAATCLIAGGGNEVASALAAAGVAPTFAVRSLGELAERLRQGGPGMAPPEALPPGVAFLEAVLNERVFDAAPCSYPRIGQAQRGFAVSPSSDGAPTVLHVDCGDGSFTKTLHSHGLDARGLDAHGPSAAAAQQRGLAATALPAFTAGAMGPAAEAAFDCVMAVQAGGANETPSLLLDGAKGLRADALEEAWRILRPGGALAVEWTAAGGGAAAAAAAAQARARGFTLREVVACRLLAVK